MAALTAKARKNILSSKFALPGGRFPVENKKHARLAIGGATRSERAGNITPEQATKVKHRADHVLGKTDSTYHGKC
jgi:hypothetical protein